MKRKMIFLIVLISMMVLFTASSAASANNWWLLGRVRGNIDNRVVTVALENKFHSARYETSTNKNGYYAFSDAKMGAPSDYRLFVYVGIKQVRTMDLEGIKAGGRVPTIVIEEWKNR